MNYQMNQNLPLFQVLSIHVITTLIVSFQNVSAMARKLVYLSVNVGVKKPVFLNANVGVIKPVFLNVNAGVIKPIFLNVNAGVKRLVYLNALALVKKPVFQSVKMTLMTLMTKKDVRILTAADAVRIPIQNQAVIQNAAVGCFA